MISLILFTQLDYTFNEGVQIGYAILFPNANMDKNTWLTENNVETRESFFI